MKTYDEAIEQAVYDLDFIQNLHNAVGIDPYDAYIYALTKVYGVSFSQVVADQEHKAEELSSTPID